MRTSLKSSLIYFLLGLMPIIVFIHPTASLEGIIGKHILNLLELSPYLCLSIIGYLGYRLNQTRILFTAIGFLIVYIVAWDSIEFRKILATVTPITLMLFFMFKESPFGGNKTLFRLVTAMIPGAALTYICFFDRDLFSLLLSSKFVPIKTGLPDLAWATSLLYIGFGLFYKDSKVSHFLRSTIFALVPVYLWMVIGFREGISAEILEANKIISFSIASFVMIHAIYLMYWQRVYVDELTSLPNRRALDEKINTLEGNYSIAMIDIDHFKKFNDNYGHDQGDDALRLVARVLESALGDKVYRYGGEEFAAVFQGVSAKDAKVQAERARSDLAKIRFIIRTQKGKDRKVENRGKVKGAKSVKVTISVGLSNYSKHADCPEKVIKRADSALYKAKKNGRNCVVVAA